MLPAANQVALVAMATGGAWDVEVPSAGEGSAA